MATEKNQQHIHIARIHTYTQSHSRTRFITALKTYDIKLNFTFMYLHYSFNFDFLCMIVWVNKKRFPPVIGRRSLLACCESLVDCFRRF